MTHRNDLRDPAGDRPPRRAGRPTPAGRLRARDRLQRRPGRGRARVRGRRGAMAARRGPGRRRAGRAGQRRGRARRSSRRSGSGCRSKSPAGLRTRGRPWPSLWRRARRARSSGRRHCADPAFAGELVATHGPTRIAVAIDVRDGLAVGHGWVPGAAGVDAADAIRRLSDVGVTTFEVTAIDRDGLLGGPDLALYERLIALDAGDDHRLGRHRDPR